MLNNARQVAVRNLTVEASDIENVNLVATAGFRLSGHITIDGADTAAYRVGLSNENSGDASYSSGNSPGSQFSISGISPGNYRVTLMPINGRDEQSVYIKSIRFDSVEYASAFLHMANPRRDYWKSHLAETARLQKDASRMPNDSLRQMS
jgi:predicted phage tail protein